MAAGERARRRDERDRVAAAATIERKAAAARQARRDRRRDRLTGWVPRPAPVESGTLAFRKRQRTGLIIAAVVSLNVLVVLGTDTWAPRVFFVLLCVLVAPIATFLINRK
jgi:Flp pilus assembly protein TadB